MEFIHMTTQDSSAMMSYYKKLWYVTHYQINYGLLLPWNLAQPLPCRLLPCLIHYDMMCGIFKQMLHEGTVLSGSQALTPCP